MGNGLKKLSIVASVIITALATPSQAGANDATFGFDASFGSGGVATHSLPVEASSLIPISGVIDSVGRLVSIINFNFLGGVPGYKLARFTSTGVLDETFGTGGLTQPVANIIGLSIVQLPDNSFVVGGLGTNSTELRAYTPEGVLDETFGTNGTIQRLGPGFIEVRVNSGRIIAIEKNDSSNSWEMGIRSYTFAGALDTSFGMQGVLVPQAHAMFDDFVAVDAAVTDDGHMLVLGQVELPPTQEQIDDSSLPRTQGVVVIRYTADGLLDTSFGGINPSPPGHLLINAGANQFIGALRITAAENTAPADANNDKFMVMARAGSASTTTTLHLFRFDSSGSSDTGFGVSGMVDTERLQFDSDDFLGFGFRMLSNGGTFIGISDSVYSPSVPSVVIKLAPNGSFDTNFSDDGIFDLLEDSNNKIGSVLSLIPTGSGSVVVIGVSGTDSRWTSAIAKVNHLGVMDEQYGLNGVAPVQINLQQPLYAWTHVYENSNGTWIVAGDRGSLDDGVLGGAERFVVVARLGTNGQLDAAFGVNGVVSLNLGDDTTNLHAMNVLPDGKILLLLRAEFQDTATVLVRLLPNGVLDSTFDGPTGNGNGVVRLTAGFYSSMGMTVDSIGRIIVVGRQNNVDRQEHAVMQRFNSNGELDTDFDGASGIGNGIVTFPITDEHSFTSVLLDADGRYIVTGFNEGVTFVGRVRSDGILDTTFGQVVSGATRSGMTRIEVSDGRGGSVASQIDAVQVLPDGALMIAGDIQTFDGPNEIRRVFAMRLLSNGSLDENFDGSAGGANGLYILPVNIAGLEDFATDMVVANDGTVLITGHSTTSDQSVIVEGWGLRQAFVVRMNQRGVIDTSLAANGFQMFNGDYPTMMFRSIIASASGRWIVVGRAGGIWSEHGVIMRLTSGAVPQSETPSMPSTPTSPVQNAPAVVAPVVAVTAPAKVAPKLAKPVVRRKKSVTRTALMKYMKLTMPKGAKVTITVSAKSKRFCRLSKARIVYVRPGKCSVRVTVKPKKEKSRSARTVMVVKR